MVLGASRQPGAPASHLATAKRRLRDWVHAAYHVKLDQITLTHHDGFTRR